MEIYVWCILGQLQGVHALRSGSYETDKKNISSGLMVLPWLLNVPYDRIKCAFVIEEQVIIRKC